jgi:hypothetical protein
MVLEIPGQQGSAEAEARATGIKAAKDAGGWCHRATAGMILMGQNPVSGQVTPVPVTAPVPCFGRDGLCQMWSEKDGKCMDRVLADARVVVLSGGNRA